MQYVSLISSNDDGTETLLVDMKSCLEGTYGNIISNVGPNGYPYEYPVEYTFFSTTTAKKSIEQGEGVCQDFAHILICLARMNNLPARYINGFLLEDLNSQENSTHAWVEIFVEDLGWVGFDPSHNKCIDEKYVRISCGYDFLDASTTNSIADLSLFIPV